jgi:hypothetical protein
MASSCRIAHVAEVEVTRSGTKEPGRIGEAPEAALAGRPPTRRQAPELPSARVGAFLRYSERVDPLSIVSMQATAGNGAVASVLAQRQPAGKPGTGSGAPAPGTGPATPAPQGAPTPAAGPDAKPKVDPIEAALARIEAELDDKIKTHPFMNTPAKRRQFLKFERGFFGSDDATIDHFKKIRKAAIPGDETFLHEEMTTRLLSVATEMGKKMPQSGGNGWAFRSPFDTGAQDAGDFHRVGLAIDYNATETPHLGMREQVADVRQLEFISIITGRVAQMNLGDNAALVAQLRKMGDASLLADEKARDAVLKAKASTDILAKVRSEAASLETASATFQDSLGADGAKLVQLQKDYFATNDPKLRADIFAKVPPLLTVWTTKLDAIVKTMEDDIVKNKEKVADLPAGPALAAEVTSTNAMASSIAGALEALKPPKPGRGPKAARGKKKMDPVAGAESVIARARTALGLPAWVPPALAPDVDPTEAHAAALQDELNSLATRFAERGTALAKKGWRDRVLAIRNGLTSDVSFVFGRQEGKKARPVIEVGMPPIAQLVDRGFFTTKARSKAPAQAFNVDFVEVMARHGFAPGARFDHPDSMHFELFWPGGK